MKKKYKLLTDDTTSPHEKPEITLYRIRALKDIEEFEVAKGDLGGYIESEANLDQRGKCWVGPNSEVYGKGRVYDNAFIEGEVSVFDNASVYGNAIITSVGEVRGNAEVFGNAVIEVEGVRIYDECSIYENAKLQGENVTVRGKARICGNAVLDDEVCVQGQAIVCGTAKISGYAHIDGTSIVYEGEVDQNTKLPNHTISDLIMN